MPVFTSAHSPTEGRHCRFAATTVPAARRAARLPRGTRHEGLAGEGANLQDVPLEQVPLAGSIPLKGRQAEFYKYQSG